MAESNSKRGALLRVALWVLGLTTVVVLSLWAIRALLDAKSEPQKKPPKISLLPDRPPPPPPPPPPPKERPEPPKAEQKEIKSEPPKEPQPQAQNEPLKMEGQAGDGPSPFAAGAVNKEYAGGPVASIGGSGGAIGGNRMQQGLFAERLQRYLQEELNRNRKLRETDYRVVLSLWLARDGKVQRAELTQSTGNVDVDALLQQTLLQVAAMREAPPDNLKQPIRIRVTARGSR